MMKYDHDWACKTIENNTVEYGKIEWRRVEGVRYDKMGYYSIMLTMTEQVTSYYTCT